MTIARAQWPKSQFELLRSVQYPKMVIWLTIALGVGSFPFCSETCVKKGKPKKKKVPYGERSHKSDWPEQSYKINVCMLFSVCRFLFLSLVFSFWFFLLCAAFSSTQRNNLCLTWCVLIVIGDFYGVLILP